MKSETSICAGFITSKRLSMALTLCLMFAPLSLRAQNVDLKWTASTTSGATTDVYRGNASGVYDKTLATGLTGSTFKDVTVTAGQTFYYMVRALLGSTESPNSNEVIAVIPPVVVNPPPPPPPPVTYNFTVTPASLAYSYAVGGTSPSSQTISLKDNAPSGTNFGFSASCNQPWCVVTPATGRTSSTLTVGIVTASLTTAGLRTATVTITGTDATKPGNSPLTVPVSINVTGGVTPPPVETMTCTAPVVTPMSPKVFTLSQTCTVVN